MLISPLHFKEFDGAGVQAREARPKPFATKKKEEVVEAPPPPPTFSEEELANAKREAYQKGFLDGTKEGHNQAQSEQTEVDRIIMEGLEAFVKNIKPVFSQYNIHCQQLKQNMPILALAIAKKVAEAALSDDMQNVLETATRQCAETMISEPQVTLTVNARLSDAISNKLKKISAREKIVSDIYVVADENIALSDYRIEWKNGSIERNVSKLWEQMDKVIENMLATIAHEKAEQFEMDVEQRNS